MAGNEFTLYTANRRGDNLNTSYPQGVRVTDLESFRAAVSLDHVSAKYAGGYAKKDAGRTVLIPFHRSIEDFGEADAAMYDADNTPVKDTDGDIPPEQWITPAHVRAAFSGVPFYVSYSRNHMKQKGRYSPRPRFHVYFAIDPITDAAGYKALKDKVCAYFPQFDTNAKDAARFFFGVENPQVEFYESNGPAMTLTAFMNTVTVPLMGEIGGSTKPGAVSAENNVQGTTPPGLPAPPKSRKIHEGQRNNTLSHRAGQLLKRYGDKPDTRRRFDEVCALCVPRLDAPEENTIYRSAQQFFHSMIEQSPAYKPADLYDAPPFAIPTEKGFTISPPLLADYYLERHTVIIVTDTGNPQIFEYDDGAYIHRTELAVKAALGEYITAFRRGLWQSGKIAEAYSAIIHTPGLYVEQNQLNANPDIVCLKNGLLNLREWKLYPHSPEKYYTARLDCHFTTRIPATPVYDKALYDYCEGSEEKQRFIMQYQGAVFSNVPGYKFKRFLLTIGEKDSGKTILKRLTEIIVGEGNYNNCDLADLENNRFAAASLHLKRLSGTNDLRAAKVPEVGRLLQLTGGDSMRVERKGEQDFSMIYTGYIWHVGNNKPIYGGKQNEALYLREILFELNHTIPQAEQDHRLIDKLLSERQGIILKCLQAARRAIYDNDFRFDVPAECDRAKKEHKHANNVVSQFLTECAARLDLKTMCKEEAEKHTAAKVWQAFKSWRDYVGEYKGLTRNDFEGELANLFKLDVKNIKPLMHSGDIVGRFYPVMLNMEGIKYNGDNFLC